MAEKIILIGFGGTIVSTHTEQGVRPGLSLESLLADHEESHAKRAEVVCEELLVIDSSKILAEHLLLLAKTVDAHLQDPEVLGIVITHGTDTLEESAYFLMRTLAAKKPVCFTAAQRTASEANPDGPVNLAHALHFVSEPAAANFGVCISMNGKFYSVQGLQKIHTSALDAFANQDNEKTAFAQISDGQLHVHYTPKNPAPLALETLQLPLPRVDIIYDFPGSDATLIRASIDAGSQGLVIQAMGAGNVSGSTAIAIEDALKKGLTIMIATRVPFGKLHPKYGGVGGGHTLLEAGCLFPDETLPASQARIELQLLLARNQNISR